jgi:hypothetical protein
MSKKQFFETLGAPLANPRWSWGAVRSSDGAVFLRVWQDRIRRHDGSLFVRVTHEERFADDPDNLGYQERGRHVELIRAGAPCFLVMCEAVDVDATPRAIKDFNKDEVFPGGRVVQLDGDWWVELLPRVRVRDLMKDG